MVRAWCVRAGGGAYAEAFLRGGFVAVGWEKLPNLARIEFREQIAVLYERAYPEQSLAMVRQGVGQIARFILEMKMGDVVITPESDGRFFRHGRIMAFPASGYSYRSGDRDCPLPHRREVQWAQSRVDRYTLSEAMRNTLRSGMPVFAIKDPEELFAWISFEAGGGASNGVTDERGLGQLIGGRIDVLRGPAFETVVRKMLTGLGFDLSVQSLARRADGFDVEARFTIAGLIGFEMSVRAMTAPLGNSPSIAAVKRFREEISRDSQGLFITNAHLPLAAYDLARTEGGPLMTVIGGAELVQLVVRQQGLDARSWASL